MKPQACVHLAIGIVGGMLLVGCGTREVYRDEAFASDTPYSKRFSGAGEIVCDSVKRALLNQGYLLEPQSEPGVLTGTKSFQQDEEMVALRLRTTCLGNRDGTHTVFATAQQEVSELQTLKQPASVSLGTSIGLTLPGGSARIPMTVKRETVQDAEFYQRFYKHVEELITKAGALGGVGPR